MVAAIERFITAGLLRFRLRSRAAMARALRLTGAAVAAFVVAELLFSETVPILAPLTALLVVEINLKDIVTSGVQRVASVTAGVLLAPILGLLYLLRAHLPAPGRHARPGRYRLPQVRSRRATRRPPRRARPRP